MPFARLLQSLDLQKMSDRMKHFFNKKLTGLTRLIMLCTASIWLLFASLCGAFDETVTEYELKAVFLYNFSVFIKWPEKLDLNAFNICVLGEDPFNNTLKAAVEHEKIQGKPYVVKNIDQPYRVSETELKECQIAFINNETRNMERLLKRLQGYPILTVSDGEFFNERGGMIELYPEGKRIRLAISNKALKQVHLKADPQLLKLARLFDE